MKEQSYLELVLQKLKEKIEQTDQRMQGNQKDIDSMHQYFWENYTEMDEYGYEMYDNSNALKSRITEQGEAVKEKFRFEKMLQSPYFGRVDFCYDGEEESEAYYIGIGTLSEEHGTVPYIFDWRAPVAGLFYDFDKGPGSFEAPAGILTGEITKKKQYKIKNGKLIYVLENDMNIDDEILQQELSEHADAKLKSIVTTIQKEQNAIIRDASHRILAVQGCAGSGKTSVALHRIAYLLYHNRKKLQAAQVLILSPNSIFADYISKILPELGEENICEMTLDDYAYRELRIYGEAEDRYDEIEKLLHQSAPKEYFREHQLKARSKEADYKQTKEYVKELDGFVLELEYEIVNLKDFEYKKMRMSEKQISEMFYEKLCDVPIFSRMHKIGEYLIDEQETLMDKNMPEEEQQVVFEKLEQMYETTDLLTLYQRFLKESGRTCMDLSGDILRYEDVYPLLYLKYAIYELPNRRQVKHLVIDEMQDYSYLQYRIIEKLFACPMTILGDKVQTMAEEHQDVLKFLPKIFGKEIYQMELNKSYRSTSEITDFAAGLIGIGDQLSVERHGERPETVEAKSELQMFERVAEHIGQLKNEMDTIAVLCLDAESAADAKRALQSLVEEEVTLLTKDSMKFQTGVCVMPFYLAKGLEFDAVLVPNLQNYRTPMHKQALYINATRALHLLKMYAVSE